jgi:FtsP/CotA-like multicopper oxidase with cupredoxin domain
MISRRDLLRAAGLATLSSSLSAFALDAKPDYQIDISTTELELSPQRRIRTTAYNGQAPGSLLRLNEGRPVTVEVTNRTDREEVIHWLGLRLPPAIDGAVEDGTPPVAPGAVVRYTFTPRPPGFRWYHTHSMAMTDLTRGQYCGQHGRVLVEPRNDPARYDQEYFVALHDWAGGLAATDDGAMSPEYRTCTINGKTLGYGEPLRVRRGQRILLHVLNSSATEVHWIALAGHGFRVIALDGNPVATSRLVSMLRLAPAERVCAIVEMNTPGVWVLGEVRKHIRAVGMGIVVEYSSCGGTPNWQQPTEPVWNYEQFAAAQPLDDAAESPIIVPLVFESQFRGHGSMEGWTINGKSYPNARVDPLIPGRRYRLKLINNSAEDHPLHLHRHSFELHRLGDRLHEGKRDPTRDIYGVIKDVVLIDAQTQAEIEFTADNPGATLFHCHQQTHMDRGFMMLFDYA